jgi:hypothetical protein
MVASPPSPKPTASQRLRRFLLGPKLVDRGGLAFLLAILVLIAAAFGVAFYAWATSHGTAAPAPIQFSAVSMVNHNATFTVSSVQGGPYPAGNFTIQFTFNNFASNIVSLPAGGGNTTLVIGNGGSETVYHIRWLDADHNGSVSAGDVFWVTGDGTGLAGLSYCNFSLIWDRGVWAAQAYWTTSNSIV